MINEDVNVSRVMDALLALFFSKNKDYTKRTMAKDAKGESVSLKNLTKDERRIQKFFHRTAKSVKKDGLTLQCVAEEYRVPGLCSLAVKANGNALEFVPEKNKTPALCLKALKKTPEAIRFVPESLQAMCQTQLNIERFHKGFFNGLRNFTERIKNYLLPKEQSAQELLNCLNILQNIGTENKTKEQLNNELLQNFKLIPDEAKNYELCRKVVKNNSQALEYVPKRFLTEELCLEVLKNPLNLQFVPDNQKSLDICLIAFLKNSKSIEFIPPYLKKEVIEKATEFKKSKEAISSPAELEKFLTHYGKIASNVLSPNFATTQMKRFSPDVNTEKTIVTLPSEPGMYPKLVKDNINNYLNSNPQREIAQNHVEKKSI